MPPERIIQRTSIAQARPVSVQGGPRQSGFTLVETLVVVAIVGILTSLAVGTAIEPLRRQQRAAYLRQWQDGLQVARLEAMRRGRPVSLAALPFISRNGGATQLESGPRSTGLVAYIDLNFDGTYDGSYTGTNPSESYLAASGEPILWAYVVPSGSPLSAYYEISQAYTPPTGIDDKAKLYSISPLGFQTGGLALLNYLDPLVFAPSGHPLAPWRVNNFGPSSNPMTLWSACPVEWVARFSDSRLPSNQQQYAAIVISRIGAMRPIWF